MVKALGQRVYIIQLILVILGVNVGKTKHMIVYLDSELSDWLETKAIMGYKKAGLVRHLLREQMKREGCGNGSAQ